MKKRYLTICIFCTMSLGPVWAQEEVNTNEESSEWMETIEIREGFKVTVPKGSKVEMKDGQIKLENTTNYMVRKLNGIEKRLEKIEATQSELRKKVDNQNNSGTEGMSNTNALRDEFQFSLREIHKNQKDLEGEIEMLKQILKTLQNKTSKPSDPILEPNITIKK